MAFGKISSLNKNYSTTILCYKLLNDNYFNKDGIIKNELKFKINIPKFKIQNSKLIKNPKDKFETFLYLPERKRRKGEGGLRTKGYFKFNYKLRIKNNMMEECWIVNNNDSIEIIDFPNEIGQYLSISNLNNINNPKSKIQNSKFINLPLVTIITVVYNGEKYLEETIKSVIKQTYPNVEYIIIDGGSTDRTLDIIKKYENYIDYWVSENDKGIYDAMNKGLITSLGSYIGILNSDDYYIDTAIEKSILEILKTESDYSIANAKFSNKGIIKPIIPLKKKIYQEMPYPHVTAFISKNVYKKVGLFNTKFKIAGDHDMAIRIILNDFKYCYLNEIIAVLKEGGISNGIKSNYEFLKISINHNKNKILAIKDFLVQILKFYIIKIFPNNLVKYIQKIKGSRFAD